MTDAERAAKALVAAYDRYAKDFFEDGMEPMSFTDWLAMQGREVENERRHRR